jgi:hypothetical protein
VRKERKKKERGKKMKKILTLGLIAASAVLFSACTSSSSGINMDEQTAGFQNGASAGCETAKGAFTKDYTAWKNDIQYQNGWFYGRKKCNPSDARE